MVGAFLTLSPEYCFVMDGEQGVCGFICAALDAVEFQKKTVMTWVPSIRAKYPKPTTNKLHGMTRTEEVYPVVFTFNNSLSEYSAFLIRGNYSLCSYGRPGLLTQ